MMISGKYYYIGSLDLLASPVRHRIGDTDDRERGCRIRASRVNGNEVSNFFSFSCFSFVFILVQKPHFFLFEHKLDVFFKSKLRMFYHSYFHRSLRKWINIGAVKKESNRRKYVIKKYMSHNFDLLRSFPPLAFSSF